MSTGLCLEWRTLNYSVPYNQQSNYSCWNQFRKAKHTNILKNASGQIKTGDFVAILGCSGAGKTTLLAAISQRLRGNLTGEILLNGTSVDRNQMTRLSSFLPQFDIYVKNFTAYEHLYFMSHFKMHRKTTKAQKRQQVTDLLLAVGLRDVTNTRIQQLSGGERKRLSLAEELITDPPFLFCDEPTTGLDSYSAYTVLKTVRHLCTRKPRPKHSVTSLYGDDSSSAQSSNMNSIEMEIMDSVKTHMLQQAASSVLSKSTRTHQRKAVICSIHQPTSDIFQLFTHIILMDAGRIVFQGNTENAFKFFTTLGYAIPSTCNPADFYLKTLSEHKSVQNIREKYEQETEGLYSGSWLVPKLYSADYLQDFHEFKKISWIYQVYLLLNRFFIEEKRNLRSNFINLALFMITSVTLSIMYSGMSELTQISVQDVSGSLFMLSSEMIFTFSYGVVYVFPAAMPILRREVGEGTYSLSAYFVAVVLSFLPMAFLKSYLFLSLIYGTIFYARGFVLYLSMGLVLSLAAVAATGYGIFLSSFFETDRLATECAAPFDLIFLVLGGVYYNVDSIPFLKYISLFYYTYEALMYNFWIGVDKIACSDNLGHPCVKNGIEVLERGSYHTTENTFWVDCIGLIGVTIAFNILAYYMIRKYVRRCGYY